MLLQTILDHVQRQPGFVYGAIRFARMLRRHRPLLLNWFKAKGAISGGTVEGFNNKAKLTMKKGLRLSQLSRHRTRAPSHP